MNRNDSSAPLRRFFEDAFYERVNRSPQTLTALGIKKYQDQLDDLSAAKLEADRDQIQDQLQRLGHFDYASLSRDDQLNYRIFKRDAVETLARYPYRFHDYLINQKFGLHTQFPAFMINMHAIDGLADAQHYIARLHAVQASFRQVIEGLDRRESLGVMPPVFLYSQIIADCRNFIGERIPGAFLERDVLEQNVLYEDFQDKIEKSDGIKQVERLDLLNRVRHALQASVIPAYRGLIAHLEQQAHKAPDEAGAWALPDGANYYRMCLARHTSTALSANDIHQLGLQEVARIQHEMCGFKQRLGFHGSLQDFFFHVREKPDFHYPQNEAGRQDYLQEMNRIIGHITTLLPKLFTVLPEDALRIKAVERHREKTAGIAFYEGPAADGSRPGIFYVNLFDLRQLPTYAMEALAYHEALPGHHLQFSIANRLQHLPTFRRYIDYTAYVEGWGLYSEWIPKELGLYQDPWSDFGRQAQDLKRASRLVVDTGIHDRRWTRQQAIDYLHQNNPSTLAQVVKEVDRYIVMPGQATSYKIGMAEIMKLRKQAHTEMRGKFDLRRFHDELLRHGPLPLELLAEQMVTWIREGMDAQRAESVAP